MVPFTRMTRAQLTHPNGILTRAHDRRHRRRPQSSPDSPVLRPAIHRVSLFVPGPRSPRGAVPGVAYSLPFVQHSAPETRAVAHFTPD